MLEPIFAVGTQCRARPERRVMPGVLDGVPGFVCGHTHGRHRVRAVHGLRERERLGHRVVVIRQHALGTYDFHVRNAGAAEQLLSGLRAGEPARRAHLRILLERAFHPCAGPQRQSEAGEYEEQVHGIKNHRAGPPVNTLSILAGSFAVVESGVVSPAACGAAPRGCRPAAAGSRLRAELFGARQAASRAVLAKMATLRLGTLLMTRRLVADSRRSPSGAIGPPAVIRALACTRPEVDAEDSLRAISGSGSRYAPTAPAVRHPRGRG